MFSRDNSKGLIAIISLIFTVLMLIILWYRITVGSRPYSVPQSSTTISNEEVLPIEDLMREHGVLNRLLLIYENISKRIEKKEAFPKELADKAVHLIKSFIEDYHEKQEEDYIFPIFQRHNKEVELVQTLLLQHEAGRRVTEQLLKELQAQELNTAKIANLMKQFIIMYRPHEAREDTELFPKLHELLSAEQFKELGEKFEEREKELFGDKGFEHVVDQVAGLEKTLGIYNLEQFTPQVKE